MSFLTGTPRRRHSRESGNPWCFLGVGNMDSRFRGNDVMDISKASDSVGGLA